MTPGHPRFASAHALNSGQSPLNNAGRYIALVTVTPNEFDLVYDHLAVRHPKYRNMHLREVSNPNGKRTLRYLHAMYAHKVPSNTISGMISGPVVFWHYQIVRRNQRTQINVITEQASPKERDRILQQFIKEILRQIRSEVDSGSHPLNYLPGQYYLRRHVPGMLSNHQNCISAVTSCVLSPLFVSQLASWNFALLHP